MEKKITTTHSRVIGIMAAVCFFLISLTTMAQHPGGNPPHGGNGHNPHGCNAHYSASLDSIPNDISFHSAEGSSTATYAWDFGDGSSSTDENPSHTFGAAGIFYVCLTVTDTANGGCTDTNCDSVHVFTPAPHCNAHFFSSRDTIDNGIRFRSFSSSNGATYAWDLGDGSTSSDQNPDHVYSAPGTYYVCLTVSNSNAGGTCSDTHCDSVHVFTPAPHCNAHFFSVRDSVANGRRFYGSHNSYGAVYAWDFGDGSSSADENPAHAYADTGMYYVCLTVTNTNAGGTCSDSHCDSVHVYNPAPHCNAHFGASTDSVANGVDFHGSNNTSGATYAWDFGDGNTSTDQSPVNLYSAAGTYNVCLTVTNTNAGGTCTDTECDSINTNHLHTNGGWHHPGGHGHMPGHHYRLASDVNTVPSTDAVVSIYPNPMTDVSVIHVENTSGNASLQIIDSNGRIAISKILSNGDLEISRKDLSEGLYFYSVTDGDMSIAKGKIIVQ